MEAELGKSRPHAAAIRFRFVRWASWVPPLAAPPKRLAPDWTLAQPHRYTHGTAQDMATAVPGPSAGQLGVLAETGRGLGLCGGTEAIEGGRQGGQMTTGMEGGQGMRAPLEERGLWNYGRTVSSHLTLATPVGLCQGTEPDSCPVTPGP